VFRAQKPARASPVPPPRTPPPASKSIYDLERPGVKVSDRNADGWPIGIYTRQILRKSSACLKRDPAARSSARRRTWRRSPAKLKLGAADAGFVYVNRTRSSGEAATLTAIPPPVDMGPAAPSSTEGCVGHWASANPDRRGGVSSSRLPTKPVQAKFTAAGFPAAEDTRRHRQGEAQEEEVGLAAVCGPAGLPPSAALLVVHDVPDASAFLVVPVVSILREGAAVRAARPARTGPSCSTPCGSRPRSTSLALCDPCSRWGRRPPTCWQTPAPSGAARS